MNFIKNIRLRYKPLLVFAILAVINAGGIYMLKQFVVDEIMDHVLPAQRLVGEFAFLSKKIQAEVLEYVGSGEEESVGQFMETSAQLASIAGQMTLLASNDEELEIMAANEAVALNILDVGNELIANHAEVLELLEAFEEAEQAQDAALDLIDMTALASESDLTSELLTQILNRVSRVQAETLEYALTGEEETLEELTELWPQLLTNIEAIRNLQAANATGQAARLQNVVDNTEQIALISEQVVTKHEETLLLLEELEELEGWAEETRLAMLGLLDRDINAMAKTANQSAWVSGLVVQMISLLLGLVLARTIVQPILKLVEATKEIAKGNFATRMEVTSGDELGELMTNFNEMAARIGHSVTELRQQSQAISASSEVSHRLSTILNPAELTTAVVELLKVTFNYYHAHIYLYDETREHLVMAGGTGEAGLAMLSNNHKIEAGKGLVGRTAAANKPTLVPDVTADSSWLPNPLLPETKAELAVPITLDNEVLGVLDIQNNIVNSLDETDVKLLISVADQVAIGLQNAKLFAQVEQEKAQMQTILAAVSAPIVISRVATGLVAYVNDAIEETFKLPREQLIGQLTPDFYADPADRVRFLTALREQGVAKDFEMLMKRGNGELFWGMASGRIINYEGQPAIVASLIDIHSRKEVENLLAKQASELSIVAQVSTAAATTLKPKELLQQVVDLTKSSFDLYHAHIHLLDEPSQMLVLTAGAGEVGQKMVAEGRRIPLTAEGSLVASVARNVAGAIRNYETPEEGFMPHPLLIETRSEMAVPIALGQQVLGVLDVRSDKLNYFGESDLQTVTTLASQVAVALQNARSYARSEEAIQELQEISRRLTREGWDEFVGQQIEELAFSYDQDHLSVVAGVDELAPAEQNGQRGTMLTQPLQVQGEAIGELLLAGSEQHREEALEIVRAVAEHLSVHLENLRLTQQTQSALNETQRRTEELAVLNEMSQTLTAQTSVDGVFQTVYTYLSRLMDTTNFYTVMYDEAKDEVSFILNASGKELQWHTEKRKAGHGVTEYIIRQRRPLLMAENVGQHLQALGVAGYGELPESWLGVPIMLGERVLGVIGLESYTTPRLYNEQHLNLVTAVANQAAIAIESVQLFEGTVALAEEEQILRQITTRVSTAIDAESILRTAAEEIGRALGLEGTIFLDGTGTKNGVKRANGNSHQ